MSTLSDQIRELQLKLEAIQEAPDDAAVAMANAASNTSAAPADGTSGGVQGDFAPVPANPNQIPTIEAATFSQAYAQAKKQGLKKFKWCGIYAVKDPVRPQPAPASNVQPRFYSQGPSDAELKDKFGRPLPKASQDLIRQGYNDSSSAGGAAG